MSVKVAVKWGKQKFEVEIDPTEPPALFKAQLLALTGVPVERQKSLLFYFYFYFIFKFIKKNY